MTNLLLLGSTLLLAMLLLQSFENERRKPYHIPRLWQSAKWGHRHQLFSVTNFGSRWSSESQWRFPQLLQVIYLGPLLGALSEQSLQ